MGDITCNHCYETTDTKNITICPNCGAILCKNCTQSNGGLCTNCYETVSYLS